MVDSYFARLFPPGFFAAAMMAGALCSTPALASSGGIDVDVELVLAVDVSYSMDLQEQRLQREGYIAALTSDEVIATIRDGIHGKIALSYMEWAGENEQFTTVDWMVIDSVESAQAFGDALTEMPIKRAYRTAVGSALIYAAQSIDNNAFRGLRRVIDISGDGTNNQGPPVTQARDGVVARGVAINGLPLMLKKPTFGNVDLVALDRYYEDCVIGGPGAFVIPVRGPEQFVDAVRTKLILEIAGRMPEKAPSIMPASMPQTGALCLAGEEMWGGRGVR